jgi:O-antigen ligase
MNRTHPLPLPASQAPGRLGPVSGVGDQPRLSRSTVWIFLALVGYTVLPVFKVPLFDLSFSAVLFVYLVINLFFGSEFRGSGGYGLWLTLAVLLWTGVLLAMTGASVSGFGSKVDLGSWRFFLRVSYWIAVFCVTVYLAGEANVWDRLVRVLCLMIFLSALARWGEVAFFGNVGAWTGTKVQSQNEYGILFSMFTPFLLVPLVASGGRRIFAALALLTVWGAAAINGSRGSWVSMAVGTLCFFLLYSMATRRKVVPLVGLGLLLGVFALALVLAPPKFLGSVSERADTFQDLDQDKSVNTRKFQVRKGWRLFVQHPFTGVGLGGFNKFVVDVDSDREDVSKAALSARSSHNAYIAFLAETGLAGSVPLGLLLLVLGWRGCRAALRLGRRGQIWALGVYISFLSMSLHLWVLHGIYNTSTWVIYGLTAGMISVAARAAPGPQKSTDMAA